MWRNTTPTEYVKGIRAAHPKGSAACRSSAGLANSAELAKLATDAAKAGFLEVPLGREKEFLNDRPVREMSGIG